MPFTFCHPAAALPFCRWRFVLSALVIGSISPDFEYFLTVSGQNRGGHTFPGVLLYTFPVALCMLAVFHGLLKWPVISLLPSGLQAKVVEPARKFTWWPPRRLILVLLSLALGIATHIIWDNLTHSDEWVGRHWSGIAIPLGQVWGGRITIEKLLQYGSTGIGAAVMVIYFFHWYRRAPRSMGGWPPRLSPAATAALVVVLCAIAIGAGSMRAARNARRAHGLSYLNHFAIAFAVTTAAVGTVELAAYSSVWWVVLGRTKNSN